MLNPNRNISKRTDVTKRYGLIGAGAVSRSVIARLPDKASELGPVTSMSYRVASRLANSLGAGTAARSISDLESVEVILFYSNPVGTERLVEMLVSSPNPWKPRVILICDTEVTGPDLQALRDWGAVVATVQQIGLPGMFVVSGDADALKAARAFVARLQGKALVLSEHKVPLFRAGLTLGTALLTPMLDRTAECFRLAGVRDPHAIELAATLFEKTSRAFGHSGKQSWVWHLRKPNAEKLEGEIAALSQEAALSDRFRSEVITALHSIRLEDERLEKRINQLLVHVKSLAKFH